MLLWRVMVLRTGLLIIFREFRDVFYKKYEKKVNCLHYVIYEQPLNNVTYFFLASNFWQQVRLVRFLLSAVHFMPIIVIVNNLDDRIIQLFLHATEIFLLKILFVLETHRSVFLYQNEFLIKLLSNKKRCLLFSPNFEKFLIGCSLCFAFIKILYVSMLHIIHPIIPFLSITDT